jgi:hypothetical protein
MKWSLPDLLENLHRDIEHKLEIARKSFAHPTAKGDASQAVWLELLQTYLPKRYQAATAFVVDSAGEFSEQIDVVIFDRQYSPFIFQFNEQTIVPAESVYAVFEAKQTIDASMVQYAQKKIASVRRLHRTSLPIPYAKGTYPAKEPIPICGGLLSFESEWSPQLGEPLLKALSAGDTQSQIDIGCIAAHGYYFLNKDTGKYDCHAAGKPATAFLFKLIAHLQFSGTVPMIDIQAYAKWLSI